MKLSSFSWLALKVGVSGALIGYLLVEIGVGDAAARTQALSVQTAALALAVLAAYTGVSAMRWLVVLRSLGCAASAATTVRITFVAVFFNQFLPTSLGADAVRISEAYRSGLALGQTVNSVLLERAAYVVSVSLLAAVGAAIWDGGRLPAGAVPALWLAFAGACAISATLAFADRLPSRMLPAAVARVALRVAADARSVFLSPGRVGALLLLAVANQALRVVALMLIANGLEIDLRAIDCIALLPAVVLVSALPISVAGWGVREYAMVTAFGYAGVPPSAALVLSLVVGLLSVLAGLPGGVLWLNRRRLPAG